MDGGLDEGTDTGNGIEDRSYRTAEHVSTVYPLLICRACIDGGRRCFPDKFYNAVNPRLRRSLEGLTVKMGKIEFKAANPDFSNTVTCVN